MVSETVPGEHKNTRIVVAMSGGVDSSVAALLLKQQGYDVIGVTMKLTDADKGPSCCGIKGVEDARNVSRKIDIPFYEVNFYREFRNRVIEPFCSEYISGRTPSPCILCNKDIKFGMLREFARGMDAESIATGHYVRVEYNSEKNRYLLKKGKDPHKDQSYFLFSLSQDQLADSIFPLGEYSKSEIRSCAKQNGLQVYNKPQSQDVCFVSGDYREFMSEYYDTMDDRYEKLLFSSGPIINEQGDTVGSHQGIVNYTVGQRKGIGAYGKSMYVKSIDAQNNTLMIAEDHSLYSDELTAEQANWIDRDSIQGPISAMVKIRYGHSGAKAEVFPGDDGSVRVVFETPVRAVAPGQATVFYDGDTVIGGGWII